MSGLEAMLQSRMGAGDLTQRYYDSLANLAGSQNAAGQGMMGQIFSGIGGTNAQGTGFLDSLPPSVRTALGI